MLNASNDARTRLASNVSESDTVVTVDSASSFPSAPFLITVDRNRENMEIMRVTEVNGEDLTVERAQEGTTASEHLQGSIVENNFTAGTYRGLLDELKNKETEIKRLDSDLEGHKASTISKVIRIDEPYDQSTTTTVDLGFTPKSVFIDAAIQGTAYVSRGYVDEVGKQYSQTYHVDSNVNYTLVNAVRFIHRSSDTIVGTAEIIDNGIRISWSSEGNLPEVDSERERRLIINAITHGDD